MNAPRPLLHRGGWTKPEAYSADLEAWLNRRRIGFSPPVNWLDLACKLVIVAGLGAGVAVWL